MKQLVQHLKTGRTVLEDVPAPQVRPGQVLIQTTRSLVSLGTERMVVQFGKSSLLSKAWQQPERVKQVLVKARSDGWRSTFTAVTQKLNQPIPLGYCNVGNIVAVGEGIGDLRVGERVASNGFHAEVVSVPRNLVASIPDIVSDDEAAFTVVGAVALQGVRLMAPTLDETIVVIGLGLIGLLTAQLLRINGCRVIGIDINETKCRVASQFGVITLNAAAELDIVSTIVTLTNSVGADGVIITASSQTDKLIAQAAHMSRKRGRIVLVGTAGLTLNRADFYQKELTFQVACSYGPGRYDNGYEQQGHDYPVAFVRWTENRNFKTILHLLATKQLQVTPLITERVFLSAYATVYDTLQAPHRIAALFTYPEIINHRPLLHLKDYHPAPSLVTIGIIGGGNFVGTTLLPALQSVPCQLKTIASAGGLSATILARKYGIPQSTTQPGQIINDPAINLCIIATRHDSHAQLTVEALRAGKHVFVEKPLAIFPHELASIIETQQTAERLIMVGFNRRFSPFAVKMKALLGNNPSPINVIAIVNAGFVPADSWVHDRAVGGGRVLGEVCHFIDFITFLTGSHVRAVCMNAMGTKPTETSDSVSLLLRYENGSTGTITYLSKGNNAYPKERIEAYAAGKILVLDDFRQLTGYGFQRFSSLKGRKNKGHAEQLKQLIEQIRRGGQAPVPFADSINTTQASLAALQSLRENRWVDVSSVGIPASTSTPDVV